MGNRKLPFGYQMRMGEIVETSREAKPCRTFSCNIRSVHR